MAHLVANADPALAQDILKRVGNMIKTGKIASQTNTTAVASSSSSSSSSSSTAKASQQSSPMLVPVKAEPTSRADSQADSNSTGSHPNSPFSPTITRSID
jgi:hypothetical protein